MKIDRWKASNPFRGNACLSATVYIVSNTWTAAELSPGFRSEKLAKIWTVERPIMTSAIGFRSTPGLEQFCSPTLPIRPVPARRHTSVTGTLWISFHITPTAVMLRFTSTQRIIRDSKTDLSGRRIIPWYCFNLLQTNTTNGYSQTRE
jgi:hypothetical protein